MTLHGYNKRDFKNYIAQFMILSGLVLLSSGMARAHLPLQQPSPTETFSKWEAITPKLATLSMLTLLHQQPKLGVVLHHAVTPVLGRFQTSVGSGDGMSLRPDLIITSVAEVSRSQPELLEVSAGVFHEVNILELSVLIYNAGGTAVTAPFKVVAHDCRTHVTCLGAEEVIDSIMPQTTKQVMFNVRTIRPLDMPAEVSSRLEVVVDACEETPIDESGAHSHSAYKVGECAVDEITDLNNLYIHPLHLPESLLSLTSVDQ